MSITISGDSPNFTTASITTGTVTTLKAPSGVLATQNGMTGIAKAWGNYNATTSTINGSFNVSSITVNATGDYTINFTTALANANYSIVGTAGGYLPADAARVFGIYASGTYTTTACRVIVVLASGGGNTRSVVNFAVFGD
jgi:hypothetical protein